MYARHPFPGPPLVCLLGRPAWNTAGQHSRISCKMVVLDLSGVSDLRTVEEVMDSPPEERHACSQTQNAARGPSASRGSRSTPAASEHPADE